MSAGFKESFATRLKEYVSRISSGSDNRILTALLPRISVWVCESGSRASVANTENVPCPKPRAGKRIERLKETAENLTAG